MKTIYLAGGCFWGVQRFIDGAQGVFATSVGYANGTTQNPSYEDVRYHGSGHAETCRVDYDENVLPTEKLLRRFLQVIDPFSVNKQGEDEGASYRTGIYYIDESDKAIAQKLIAGIEESSHKKCAVEVLRLANFYDAEEYHQKYLEKHPAGYCHILEKF